MFEAVGYDYNDEFFGICNRLLKPGGTMLLQTITIHEERFSRYRRETDRTQKYSFPGFELASLQGMRASLARATDLSLSHAEDIGLHYVYTLRAWRKQSHGALDSVRKLGFDDRFIRLWDFYLAYCEAAFRERHIGDFQLVLRKTGIPAALVRWRDYNGRSEGGMARSDSRPQSGPRFWYPLASFLIFLASFSMFSAL